MEFERTTKDGLFTLTIRFNAPETASYAPAEIKELCDVLEQTAASLAFGMLDPSGTGVPQGRPS